MIHLLLNHVQIIDINLKHSNNQIPFQVAINKKNKIISKKLIQSGSDLNAKDNELRTSLRIAFI